MLAPAGGRQEVFSPFQTVRMLIGKLAFSHRQCEPTGHKDVNQTGSEKPEV